MPQNGQTKNIKLVNTRKIEIVLYKGTLDERRPMAGWAFCTLNQPKGNRKTTTK